MARRERQQRQHSKPPPRQEPAPVPTKKVSKRERYLNRRRDNKFDRHAIQIIDQHVSEEREDRTVKFKFAVLAGKQLVGRTTTRRYALKRAHQSVRNRS